MSDTITPADAALRRQIHHLALACDSAWRVRGNPGWRYGRTSSLCKAACGGVGVADCSRSDLLRRRGWLLRWWARSMRAPAARRCHGARA
jgi:hypothetical protein